MLGASRTRLPPLRSTVKNKNSRRLSGWLLLAVGLVPACSGSGRGLASAAAPEPAPAAAAARAQAPAPPAEPGGERGRQLTRYARLLAGVDDPLAAPNDPLRASDAFKAHAREMSQLWATYDSNEATKMRPWATSVLAPVQEADTLFYPFAGADFLYSHAFFPRAHTYVLVGLERVGALSDLDAMPARSVDLEYGRIEKAVTPLLRATFFRTMEMQSDVLKDGVLTVLATLIAGTHHRLLNIQEIALAEDGRVIERVVNDPKLTPGARIDFADEGAADVQTLYYFRTDLSDKGLAKQGGLLAFVSTLPSKVTFMKAASYLMQGKPFSVIRGYVLSHSQAVLEDDTGVPLSTSTTPVGTCGLSGNTRGRFRSSPTTGRRICLPCTRRART